MNQSVSQMVFQGLQTCRKPMVLTKNNPFFMQMLKSCVFTVHKKVQICMTECILIQYYCNTYTKHSHACPQNTIQLYNNGITTTHVGIHAAAAERCYTENSRLLFSEMDMEKS